MPATLEFHGRDPITYKSAANKEGNIIHQLTYLPATAKLLQEIWEQRKEIEALAKHHLGLGNEYSCTVLEQATWTQGSFNICVPIEAKSDHFYRKVIFRRPIPHRLAEGTYPGTIDEKLSCEVGAYTWMQDKCPNIRIPHLYGFGFSNSRNFTHVRYRPLYVRFVRMVWRYIYDLLQYPALSQYTSNPTSGDFRTPYMVLEYIDSGTGQMLSKTWSATGSSVHVLSVVVILYLVLTLVGIEMICDFNLECPIEIQLNTL